MAKARELFGQRLAALMAGRKMSPADLAREMKRSEPWVSNLLNGKRGTTMATLDEIAAYFDVPVETMLARDLAVHTPAVQPNLTKNGTVSKETVQNSTPVLGFDVPPVASDSVRGKGRARHAVSARSLAVSVAELDALLDLTGQLGAIVIQLDQRRNESVDGSADVKDSARKSKPSGKRRVHHKGGRRHPQAS